MAANLTPQYRKAEEAYRRASGDEEKLACLEEMFRLMPKHKGTDHLQADLKRRMSQLRRGEKKTQASRRAAGELVDKQGAGQVVLLGGANVGKSRLVAALTDAPALVAEYPYSTQRAQPGMMKFEDAQIQLVDLPAVTPDFMPTWVPDMVRRADMSLLVADLGTDDVVDQIQVVLDRLAAVKIELHESPPPREDGDKTTHRRALIVANKCDLPGAEDRLGTMRELLGECLPMHVVSAETGQGLDDLPRVVFQALHVIRVYSKVPHKPADMSDPFVLPEGANVLDFARTVHKELADKLARARIWGEGLYDGQFVKRDHVLADRDVVELHE